MSWDAELAPLAALVGACAAAADESVDLRVTRLVVETPMELRGDVASDGTVELRVAPPRQGVETTVMPVLHRLRLVVEPEPRDADDEAGP